MSANVTKQSPVICEAAVVTETRWSGRQAERAVERETDDKIKRKKKKDTERDKKRGHE